MPEESRPPGVIERAFGNLYFRRALDMLVVYQDTVGKYTEREFARAARIPPAEMPEVLRLLKRYKLADVEGESPDSRIAYSNAPHLDVLCDLGMELAKMDNYTDSLEGGFPDAEKLK